MKGDLMKAGGIKGIAFSVMLIVGVPICAGPPVPFLDDTEPGLDLPFSGDPDTTEAGCAQDAPRASAGGEGGKMHNELLECDNWDFSPRQWGQASFLQGSFILGDSTASDDGAWSCPGNFQKPNGGISGPCNNPTVRAVTTYRNQPAPGPSSSDGAPMDPNKDWVLRFDFKIEFVAGDTFGSDKLFEISSRTIGGGGNTSDLVQLNGGFGVDEASFSPEGLQDRYYVNHGPWLPEVGDHDLRAQNQANSLIDIPMDEGTVTVHYRSAVQLLDLYFNDQLVLADFESLSGHYDVDFIQLGGGSTSFEIAQFDNITLGILAATGTCGPQGPGTSVSGDFNCDGVVDVADLGIVGANFNTTQVTYVDGDANLDNVVDVADLGVVGANWSAAQAALLARSLSVAGLTGVIPEPATIGVLGVGLIWVGKRRR
ncbi:MAG: hypothetical protein CMJ20_07715 [Phycisphaeraceae bacterium]|nr:hypothetical protein [Phycisphaeraceae bacterium]